LSIEFPQPSGAQFTFSLDPLFATIDPSASKFTVMSTKIEIVLRKKVPGQKWSALEATSTEKLTSRITVYSTIPRETTSITNPVTVPTPSADQGPAYPTSSRHGVKDWDKLASDLNTMKGLI
jgi:suppressor of G2 allele of SKP1